MSDFYIENLKKNNNVKIIKVIKGIRAFNIMLYLFFTLKNKEIDNNYIKKWTKNEKYKTTLIIYSYQNIKNKKYHFKFIIGNKNNRSVLGEKFNEKNYLQILKDIN